MKLFVFLFLIVISSYTFGQEIKIIAKNSEGIGVELVNVQVLKDGKVIGFIKTNDKGECFFNPKEKAKLSLKFSSLFYKTKWVEIDTTVENIFTVILESHVTQIEEIEIKTRPKLAKIKQDTISFNLNSVKDNTERNAEDIIKKLPGINITENGKVTYKGNEVGQVLVEGSDFFGKNHKMATQNLSSDMIEGIDLWQNFTTINGNSSTALNLKIKESYKGKITGNLQANYGNKNSYYAHSNLFKISKVGNFSFIADANSIAKDPINVMDFFDMNSKEGISNTENDAQLEIPSFLNNDDKVFSKENQLGAFQFSKSKNNFSVNLFSIFNNAQINRKSEISRLLYDNQSLNSYFHENRNEFNKGFFGTTQLNLKKTFTDKSFIFYNFIFNPTEDNFQEDINRTSLENNYFRVNNSMKQSSLSHYLSYNKQIGNFKVIFSVNYAKDRQNNLLLIDSDTSLFQTNSNKIIQKYEIETEKFSADYFLKNKNNFANINFHSGFRIQNENAYLNDVLSSNLENNKIKRYQFSNEINLVKNFRNLEVSASIGSYLQNINRSELSYLQSQFKLKYKPKEFSNSEFTLEYSKKYSLPSIKLLHENTRYSKELFSYHNSDIRAENLSIKNDFKLMWNNFNFNRGRFSYAYINYQVGSPSFANNLTNYNLFSNLEYVLGVKEQKIVFLVSDERRIAKDLVLKSKLSYLKTIGNNYVNSVANVSTTENWEVSQKLSTNFKDQFFQFDLGYSTKKSIFNQSIHNNSLGMMNTKFFIGFRANYKKEWYINILNEYLIQIADENTKRNFLLGGQLSYKKEKSNLEYNLLFNNLLNLNSFIYLNSMATQYGSDETRIYGLHGYITGGIKFYF